MILIIEDYQDTREVLVRLLRLDGYEASAVATGAEAIQFLMHHTPQLVILEYGLPDMNGLDILAQIRKMPRLSKVPVLMFSAYDGTEKETALRAGADAYVTKTALDWAALKLEVQKLVGEGTLPAQMPKLRDGKQRPA